MEVEKTFFFYLLDLTILNSFLFLTLCGGKMTNMTSDFPSSRT